jgi:LacI family transcriptional regulator
MRRIEEFCCQNSECPDYGKRAAGNLRWHGRSGRKQQIRMLYCRTCKSYFSERKGTALWGSRLRQEKALAVLKHVAEGCGVRQTARLVKVDKNTVSRLTLAAGEHARRVHDELVPVSPLDERDSVR